MTTPADKMPDECHRCGYSPTRDLPWDEAEWMGRKGPERVACVPVAEAREIVADRRRLLKFEEAARIIIKEGHLFVRSPDEAENDKILDGFSQLRALLAIEDCSAPKVLLAEGEEERK